MRTLFIALLLTIVIVPAVFGQRKNYDYRNLSASEIEEIKSRRLEFYRYESAGREESIKRGLLEQALKHNANQSDYDVNYYGIRINLLFPTKSIVGQIDYQVTVVAPTINSIDLDLIWYYLNADSAYVGPNRVNVSHPGFVATVTLPRTYTAGEKIVFSVYYHGTPYSGMGYTDGGMAFTTHYGNEICWTSTEPYASRNWFPCKDTPEDKADSVKFWIECPGNMQAAANGVLQSTTTLPSGRKVYHWISRYRITTYLIALSVANFEITQKTWNYDGHSMPVYAYNYPNAYDSKAVFDTLTIPMLNYYSDAFGIYPFVTEKLANVNCGEWGTMEHQTCSFHDPFAYYYDFVYLLIHENAHQWWGDMITCRTFHHIWINEGFGTWAEAIFWEAAYGGSLAAYLGHMQTVKYMGSGTIYVEDPQTQVIFDGNLSYNKGAWVVHMLRGVLGDSTFFRVVREWSASSYRYGSATTESIADFWSAASGVDLHQFFQQWIYGDGHPEYEYSFQCRPDTVGGGYLADFFVDQVQSSYSNFQMPIRLRLVTTGGIRDTVVSSTQRGQYFQLHAPDSITNIQFDPQEWILREATLVPFGIQTTTITCADGELGVFYSQSFEAVGGVAPYNWTHWGGDLPFGLSFSGGEQAVVSGVPTFMATFYFTLRCQDSSTPPQEKLFGYSITVGPANNACGDADSSGSVSIADAVFLINYIFAGGPAPSLERGDGDCSGAISIADAVYLINFIFASGPAPCAGCP